MNAVKSDGSNKIREWTSAIINHLYWVAASTPEGPQASDIMEAKWQSLLDHICNKHTHQNPLYPQCEHPRRPHQRKKYMKRGNNQIFS